MTKDTRPRMRAPRKGDSKEEMSALLADVLGKVAARNIDGKMVCLREMPCIDMHPFDHTGTEES